VCRGRCPYRSRAIARELLTVILLLFERTRVAPSRELPAVDAETDVVACLAFLGGSRFRSNSKEGNGRYSYRSRCTHRELPGADITPHLIVLAIARTVKDITENSPSARAVGGVTQAFTAFEQ